MFKRKNMIKTISLFLVLLGGLFLSSCGTGKKEITIGEGDWDSNAFHDQVVKYIVEKGYDIKVNIVLADTSLLISALTAENIDVAFEIWTDNIPSYPSDIAAGKYEEVSTNFADNKQGLYIPAYLQAENPGLVSVMDLKDYMHLFPDPDNSSQGIIYGGPEGWGATDFLHKKMALYGLDEMYNFKPIDSNAILSTTLKAAYDKGQPWVGYNWEPTWIMGIYDLILLEDSVFSPEDFELGKGAFASVDVTVVVKNKFKSEFPELHKFFSKYETTTEITNKGLVYMQENSVEADEAAKWFLETYESLWTTWVPEEVANKVIKSLG
ncbi:MAG TPA: glycine betaine ABC transporter substrate-binding protein [Acholeplasma sp.]|nr:glycine betaine ABC transporter substrate-binding protein [Acholeplasma sp.]